MTAPASTGHDLNPSGRPAGTTDGQHLQRPVLDYGVGTRDPRASRREAG
ncbi:hypothetical protein [Streptomyces sp. CA-111067]